MFGSGKGSGWEISSDGPHFSRFDWYDHHFEQGYGCGNADALIVGDDLDGWDFGCGDASGAGSDSPQHYGYLESLYGNGRGSGDDSGVNHETVEYLSFYDKANF